MLTRRALLTGGVLAPQASRGGSGGDEEVARELQSIRDLIDAANGGRCPELSTIRSQQREFLKGRGKFPDFIEVGIDIWDSLMNWHVRTRQPAQVQRTPEGRYSVAIFQTNVILRHDVQNNYVGQPYDTK